MWTRLAVAAIVGATLLVAAGCGDGDDDSTPTRTGVQLQTPTTPTAPDLPGSGTLGRGGGSSSTDPSGQNRPRPEVERVRRVLAPFRACLQQHGVDLQLWNRGALQRVREDPQRYRSEIEKSFACIPELPPRLQDAAERFKRRFEQRSG